MEKKLKDNLNAKYTKIIANGDIEYDCSSGWYFLTDELFSSILAKKEAQEITGKVSRISEKFGAMDIDHNFTDDEIVSKIEFSQKLSLRICERCGAMHNVRQTKGAWITTICGNCFDRLLDIQKDGLIF